MNLDSNLLHTLRYFKTLEESEQDKYFREKLNRLSKLNMSSYEDLMKRYVVKAASFGSVDMNEFDRDIDKLLKEEKIRLFNDPLILAVIEIKSKRIAAQQKRRMNSFGKWSKIMRDKYEV